MKKKPDLKEYGEQFRYTLFKMPAAGRFIQDNRLWEGFWKYGWVSRFLIVIALIAGLKFLSIAVDWFQNFSLSNPGQAFQSMGMVFSEGFGFLFSGGMKYAMLVLLEVLVFHFSRRTLYLLSGNEASAEFQDFVDAQVRMIKVGMYAWVMELVFTIMFKVFFGIFGFIDFLQPACVFAVQCYFLGFAILDNYHEQFGLTIKESSRYALNYVGVAAAAGLVAYLMMLIPVAGVIAAPILTSVAVTIVMYELSDLHILGKEALGGAEEVV
ncbi:MAG: hypothetical protein J5I98_03195 [Phaeodactylibacter sp.]|nr:hypothetical protein [Phaeodactylibacter sp.]